VFHKALKGALNATAYDKFVWYSASSLCRPASKISYSQGDHAQAARLLEEANRLAVELQLPPDL
jgi:hypothetical protein